MRLIPKNTKVRLQFYKGITLPDILIGLVSLALVALTISSNLDIKYIIAVIILCIFLPLFMPVGDERIYMTAFHLIKYLFSRKRFVKGPYLDGIIPYESIENGFIRNKDGSVTGVIEIKPIEFRLLAGNKQDYLIDGVLTNVLSCIGIGQELEIVKLDKQLVLSNHLETEIGRVNDLIAAYESGALSEKEYASRVDIIEDRMEVLDSLNSDDPVWYSCYYIVLHDHNEKSLIPTLDYMKQQLMANSIEADILDKDGLTKFLSLSFGNTSTIDDIAKMIPNSIDFGLMNTKLPDKQISHLCITNYPLKVYNAWAEDLFDIPKTKVVMKLNPVPKDKAIRRIDNAIIELSTRTGGKASKYIDKTTHVETLSTLLLSIQNDNELLFDVTLMISVYDDTGKTDNKKLVKQKIKELGMSCTDMFGRQQDAYLTSQIYTYDKVKISRGIQASTVAASFPFVSNAVIEDKGLLLGENKLPVIIDFFKRNTDFVNSNMIIIGKSGSGKSYATKTLLAHLASCNTKVFALDPDGEYLKLTESLGGKSLDAASPKHGIINPFHIIGGLEDEEDNSVSSYYAHLQFLEEFYKIVLPGLSVDSLELLNKLTADIYAKKGITPNSDIAKLKSDDYPVFEDLAEYIDQRLLTEMDEYNKSCLKMLVNYISKFKRGGRNSALWNGPTSFKADENFVCFNFQKLLANKNNTIANAQMLLILKWLENEVIKNRDLNHKHGTDRKIVVVIDEAHVFIDEKYPIALDFMFQLGKRIRKYYGMQIVITQSIKDFAGTQETARKSMAIINVSQYSLIFTLPPNDMSDLCALYEKAGQINEAESDNIVHNSRGCAFLISSPEKRTNIRITATPYLESLFDETKNEIKEN